MPMVLPNHFGCQKSGLQLLNASNHMVEVQCGQRIVQGMKVHLDLPIQVGKVSNYRDIQIAQVKLVHGNSIK